MVELGTNLKLAARRLLRAPAFSGVAIAAVAVAIGANLAIFSLVEALFLKPLPVKEVERLVAVYESRDGSGFYPLSYADYRIYRRHARTLEEIAAVYSGAPFELRQVGEVDSIQGAVVSGNYFRLLGIEPVHGRLFAPGDDEAPGRQPVAVISHRLWMERFEQTPDVLGRTLTLNGTVFAIVGVASPAARELRLGSAVDVWIPTSMAAIGYRWCDALDHDCTWISMVGRLAPGADIDDARAELSVISDRLRSEHPSGGETRRGVILAPLSAIHPADAGRSMRLVATLLSAVGALLVVAGASLSGLLVARAVGRRREIAVRLSLGARRSQVVSLFVAETLWIALAGGVGGLLTASWFQGLVSRIYSRGEELDLALGGHTLTYAVLLSIGSGIVVGIAPALQASRPDLVHPLRDASGLAARPRVLAGLVVAQVSLALVLVAGSGLLLRSIDTLESVGASDPERVATLRLRPRLIGLDGPSARAATREALERISRLSGVRSASLSTHFPPGRGRFTTVSRIDAGSGDGLGSQAVEAATQPVAPRFFETLGAPILQGREFDDRDLPTSEPAAIVNRKLASTLWPEGSPLGRELLAFDRRLRVVGVVDDSPIHLDPKDAPAPQLYLAYWQDPALVDSRVVVATFPPAASMLPTLRLEVGAVSSTLPVTEAEDMASRVRRTFTRTWLAGRVFRTTSLISLFLCGLCLHGVLSLVVNLRRKELGVRIALGATRGEIVALLLRQALVLAAPGLAIGLALSLALHRLLEAHLYDVSPLDPVALIGAIVALCLVVGSAAWWPALRASRVDPIKTLRAE